MRKLNLKVYTTLPETQKKIIHFIIKLAVLFTAWFLVFSLWLFPQRVIDKPITNFISFSVVKCINFISSGSVPIDWIRDLTNNHNYLLQNNQSVLLISDSCNGLDLMLVYIAIIILLPSSIKRKVIFSLGGIIAIILANIVRIISLYYIYIYHRTAFNFNHHYLFTLLIYALIFYGWLLFIQKKKPA